jgi:hypothetical protein
MTEMRTCGWCGQPTRVDPCSVCNHEDPDRPWLQRGQRPPTTIQVKRNDIRHRLAQARRELGPGATVDAIAESIGVSPRTVRRWQEMSAS